MNRIFEKPLVLIGTLALSLTTVGALRAQTKTSGPTPSQPGDAKTAPFRPTASRKTAEEVYKNIQVLKGIPADELIPTMQFFTAALTTTCDECHVEDRSKDDKETKKAARKMIQMLFAINKANFNGRPEVTCYSCHHGSETPVGIPSLAAIYSDNPPLAEDLEDRGKLDPKTSGLIVAKYEQAIGGEQAIAKVTALVEKGTVDQDEQQSPLEIFAKSGGKLATIVHFPTGDNVTTVNDRTGWRATPENGVQPLGAPDLNAAQIDAKAAFPLSLKQLFGELRVGRATTIGDQDVSVLVGVNPGKDPVKLYFDNKSGLLLRLVRFTNTAVGRNPTQIDFSDYRDVGGVKMAFQRTVTQVSSQVKIQFSEIQPNGPVDDSKFAKPARPAAKNG